MEIGTYVWIALAIAFVVALVALLIRRPPRGRARWVVYPLVVVAVAATPFLVTVGVMATTRLK
ncbi:hypothetical protein [Demequina subtropica]|uniref:hypothetical protein n=1 Tax=Demequina subtropica TaxID=1638989 RepID=UPI000785CAA3|nr:hypothetical protein [Demequina subtropica]